MFDGKNKIPTTKEEEMKAKYAAWQWMQTSNGGIKL